MPDTDPEETPALAFGIAMPRAIWICPGLVPVT
jgi:hypothetical protein